MPTDWYGPTNAVECFQFRNGAGNIETHLTAGRFRNLGCIGACGQRAFLLWDFRASPADIRHGFILPICAKCARSLEVRDAAT